MREEREKKHFLQNTPNSPIYKQLEVIRLAGFEPATYGLGIHRSILLSYRRIKSNPITSLLYPKI